MPPLRSQYFYTSASTSALPVPVQSPRSGSEGTSTVPSLTSPETLVRIPVAWWGYLNPDPRKQKTSRFGDYEEHNTQHSGFHISAQHSSLHCTRAGRTRREERWISGGPSDSAWSMSAVPRADTFNLARGEGCIKFSGWVLQPSSNEPGSPLTQTQLHESSIRTFSHL